MAWPLRCACVGHLQKSLKAEFAPSVWEYVADIVSKAFPIGPDRHVAVKVIDERSNE